MVSVDCPSGDLLGDLVVRWLRRIEYLLRLPVLSKGTNDIVVEPCITAQRLSAGCQEMLGSRGGDVSGAGSLSTNPCQSSSPQTNYNGLNGPISTCCINST